MQCISERWRKICDYLEVSSFGNIRSLDRVQQCKRGNKTYLTNFKGKSLKASTTCYGYKSIRTKVAGAYKTMLVHRLVGLAFIANPNNKPCINHIDSDRTNNHVDNLEWCTHKENTVHGYTYGNLNSTACKEKSIGKKVGKTSTYNNVTCTKVGKHYKYLAVIQSNKKDYGRKYFDTEIEAALHVNDTIDKYKLNRPKNII